MLVKKGLEQRFRAFFKFLDNFGDRAPAAVKFAVGSLQVLDALFGEAFGMQAERMQIQGTVADGVARRLGTRRDIPIHFVGAPHKGVGADLIALLNGGNTADSRIFADAHVAAQLATIRDNDAFANIAVMGDMRVGHYKYMIGDMRAATPLYRATIQGTIFTNGTIFANF